MILVIGQSLIDHCSNLPKGIVDNLGIKKGVHNKLDFESIEDLIDKTRFIHTDIGGCATNTAIGLYNSGIDLMYLGNVGQDLRGKIFQEKITNYGFDFDITTHDKETGIVLTMLPDEDGCTGCFNAFNYGCANDHVFDDHIKRYIDKADFIYMSLFSINDSFSDGTLAILDYSKESKKNIIFDGGGLCNLDQDHIREILGYPSYFIVNKKESKHLQSNGQHIEVLSESMIVIEKNGASPTILYENGELKYSIAPQELSIKNCVGAGDAFAAGFIAGIMNGKSDPEALILGNNTAAKIVEKIEFH